MGTYTKYLHFPTLPKYMHIDIQRKSDYKKRDKSLRAKMYRKAKRAEQRSALRDMIESFMTT